MNQSETKKYYFLTIILSLLYILKTNGFQMKNNRVDKNIDFLKNLVGVLKNYNAKFYVSDENVNKPKSIKDTEESKPKLNKVLVKRLVPHNYESGKYEYDEVFKTLYKPLIRFNRLKEGRFMYGSNIENENNILKQSNDFYLIERPPRDLYKPEDGYLLQPFKVPLKKRVTANKIIKDVENFVRENDPKKVKQLKSSILRNFNNKSKKKEVNTIIYIPPGHHGNVSLYHHIEEIIQPIHELPKGRPDYKWWNYWTYDKEILQDNCKGNTIQYGNICIQAPPH